MDFMAKLLIVLAVAWCAGVISSRIGYPAMLGELMAGILLGPPLLGWLPMDDGLYKLAEVGIFVMMFYIGMEIDPADLLKASKPAVLAAVGGFVVPFAAGFFITYHYLIGEPYILAMANGKQAAIIGGLFVGIAVAVTSLATKSRILIDLGLLNTRIAMVMMAGALLADTAALVVFSGIMGFSESNEINTTVLLAVTVKALVFFLVAIFTGIKIFPLINKFATRWGLINIHSNVMLALAIALLFGELAHMLGLHNIIGAFVAGIFMRRCISDRTQFNSLTKTVHQLSVGFLAPIFFITAGFEFSFSVFQHKPDLLIAVVLAAIIGKILGTMLFYLPSKGSWREGFTIGCGMNGRGAVEIIIAEIGYHKGLINAELFSILVFTAIFTTALVPFTLKLCVEWLRRHNDLVAICKRDGYLFFGAGPLARLLARKLSQMSPVIMIDRNKEHCAAARKVGLVAHSGNVLDEDLLHSLGAEGIQATVAITPNSEINLAATQFARDNFMISDNYVLLPEDNFKEYASQMEKAKIHLLFGVPVDWDDIEVRIAHQRYALEDLMVVNPDNSSSFNNDDSGRVRLNLTITHGDQIIPFVNHRPLQANDTIQVVQMHDDPMPETDRFDMLVQDCEFLDFNNAMSLEDFFDRIADKLVQVTHFDREKLIAEFMEREMESATFLGYGIAIPHIRVAGNGHFTLLIVRCREGIIFNHNQDRARIIFVMVSSPDQRNFHLRALSAIAQIAQTAQFETKWLTAAGTEDMRELILNAKRRRLPEESTGER